MLVAIDSVALCKLHAILLNERSYYCTHVSIMVTSRVNGTSGDFLGTSRDFLRLPGDFLVT